MTSSPPLLETAYFGGGCFWCTEAVFSSLKGVTSVMSGYAGGHVANPSYYQVSEGTTGHAEVIQITFDPTVISYQQLLDVFFHTHNPTTLNQQGADRGTEYRSIILSTTDAQLKQAIKAKKNLNESHEFEQLLVTEIKPFEAFYEAEEYHRNFYLQNPESMYCQMVITPKMEHFQRRYHALLKKN